jgi:hypothetical protein
MTKGFLRFLRRNTIALLALFLALGGTTYAASSALIGANSVASPQVVNGSLQTKDLSAKARKALKGNRGLRGLRGLTGAKGATGAAGAQGIQGPAGPFPANLSNGQTVRGSFYILGTAPGGGEFANESISYVYAFASAPTVHYINSGTTPPAQCPGTAASPEAQAGHTCIYEASNSNVTAARGVDTNSLVTNKNGVGLYATSAAVGSFFAIGTWAATGIGGTAAASGASSASASSPTH